MCQIIYSKRVRISFYADLQFDKEANNVKCGVLWMNQVAAAAVLVQWFQASKSITFDLLSRKILFTCEKNPPPRCVPNKTCVCVCVGRKKRTVCVYAVFFYTYNNICWINSITFGSVDRYKHVYSDVDDSLKWNSVRQSCLTFPSLPLVCFLSHSSFFFLFFK